MPVARIGVGVPDLDRAVRLFGTLVGGEPSDGPDGPLLHRADAGAAIALLQAGPGRARLRRIVLGLADLAGALDRLDAAGVAYRHDPDGVAVPAEGSGVERLGVELLLRAADPATATAVGTAGTAGTTAFDHVCLAVPSLADALHLLRDLLGGEVVFGGHNHVLGTLSSQLTFGEGTRLELLQPVRPDAAIARFLQRRGPGAHHLTWHVADVAVAERAATELGFEVVDTDVTTRAHWHETYVRPSSAMGLLVQLAWTDQHHDDPLDDDGVAAILAGEVDSFDFTMRSGGEQLAPGAPR